MGSRLWFHYLFVKTLLKYRPQAIKDAYTDELWVESSFEMVKNIEGCGGRMQLEGLHNITKVNEPMVIISNHMSTLETMIFPALIVPHKPLTFVVKESLIRNFVFGPIMRARRPIIVGRKDPARDLMTVMSEGAQKLSDGHSVLIFPQSTRQFGFDPDNFNSLGIKLARKAGVPVLPVAIKTDFWGNSRFYKEFGPIERNRTIHVKFAEPIRIKDKGLQTHQQILEFIGSNVAAWEKLDPS